MPATGADSEHDSGPQLLRDIWALAAIAIVVVTLRIFAKFRIAKSGRDDVLTALALLLAIVGSTMATVAVNHGFGRHVGTLEPSDVSQIIEYDYITQTFGIAGGTLGRVAFIVYIIGLLGVSISHRVILWALVVLQPIVNLVFILIIFLQCPGHASGIWAHSGKHSTQQLTFISRSSRHTYSGVLICNCVSSWV
ncbi:hypothetical protein N7474_005182 [Penicillium riverlandense]|uniref:uncharacterized protein n=1 Tax=Penicillium riverlandense TaxID=1903569 RepID=UPI0025490B22|nr:uncharacterized protein N7474_005182 [Penicillium riverlandense]KAJ5819591.1 hypothetical protein N7474_005182 [Penicillium riverlandense]